MSHVTVETAISVTLAATLTDGSRPDWCRVIDAEQPTSLPPVAAITNVSTLEASSLLEYTSSGNETHLSGWPDMYRRVDAWLCSQLRMCMSTPRAGQACAPMPRDAHQPICKHDHQDSSGALFAARASGQTAPSRARCPGGAHVSSAGAVEVVTIGKGFTVSQTSSVAVRHHALLSTRMRINVLSTCDAH